MTPLLAVHIVGVVGYVRADGIGRDLRVVHVRLDVPHRNLVTIASRHSEVLARFAHAFDPNSIDADRVSLAASSVQETERHGRHLFRSQLARLGVGTAAPGVWIAQSHRHEDTRVLLRRLELDRHADLFHAEHRLGRLEGQGRGCPSSADLPR